MLLFDISRMQYLKERKERIVHRPVAEITGLWGGWQSPQGFAKLSVLSVKLCHLWANLLPFWV